MGGGEWGRITIFLPPHTISYVSLVTFHAGTDPPTSSSATIKSTNQEGTIIPIMPLATSSFASGLADYEFYSCCIQFYSCSVHSVPAVFSFDPSMSSSVPTVSSSVVSSSVPATSSSVRTMSRSETSNSSVGSHGRSLRIIDDHAWPVPDHIKCAGATPGLPKLHSRHPTIHCFHASMSLVLRHKTCPPPPPPIGEGNKTQRFTTTLSIRSS